MYWFSLQGLWFTKPKVILCNAAWAMTPTLPGVIARHNQHNHATLAGADSDQMGTHMIFGVPSKQPDLAAPWKAASPTLPPAAVFLPERGAPYKEGFATSLVIFGQSPAIANHSPCGTTQKTRYVASWWPQCSVGRDLGVCSAWRFVATCGPCMNFTTFRTSRIIFQRRSAKSF